MNRFIFAYLALALTAQGAYAEEQIASGSSAWDTEFDIIPDDAQNNDVFNVVVIGDSIAWGTGLITEEKYSYLVAQWLAEQINRPVNVKVLAHTGAAIMEDEAESTDPFPYPTYYPEFTSGTPTLMEQADMISNPDEIDLILVSGGANDVGLDSVLMVDLGLLNYWDKGSSLDDIRTKSEDIRPSMFNLLNKLLSMCPDARIVVTGYFTGITDNSKGITEIAATMRPESQENPFITDYRKLDGEKKGEVVEKSRVFAVTANESLSTAVDEANTNTRIADSRNLPYDRAAFAPIFFPPERCYGTDQSWLWKIVDNPYTGTKKINDDWFDLRQTTLMDFGWYCNCELCISDQASSKSVSIDSKDDLKKLCDKNRRNRYVAIGHPNVEGAKNYSESIIREIRVFWPTWMYPTVESFDVSSRSLTSGESLEITYRVSDNDGSGLKQVELWRTRDKEKWPEKPLQTKTLADESGRSGSFMDTPPAPGKYWYGVHVVDNAGNWNDEKNSNTNGQPSSFEPVEVEVMKASTAKVSSQAPSEEWNRTFGRADNDWADYVQQTSDGGYILAGAADAHDSVSANVWICKIDTEGNEVWSRTFSGAEHNFYGLSCSVQAYSIQPMPDGGYLILAGWPESAIPSGGFPDAWLIKTDSEGNEIWNKTFGEASYHDMANSVQQTSDGGYILAGETIHKAWLFKTDSEGNEIWEKTLSETGDDLINSVQLTSDGGYILAGETESFGGGDYDAWLIKTDSEGNEIWNKTFGGTCEYPWMCHEEANSVQSVSDGGYIIFGKTNAFGHGSNDAWLIKTDSEGNEIWNKTFGGEDDDEAGSVQPMPGGGYLLAGCTNSFGDGGNDAWIIETDPEGNEIWNKTFGGKKDDSIASVQPTSDGGCILAGWTKSYGAGGSDAWLIKVGPP